jgi:hypothetical protein
MDYANKNNVDAVLSLPSDHPMFQQHKLVAEGGFLDKAPQFQEMFDRVGFTTVWCTGAPHQIRKSRIERGDPDTHLRVNWKRMVDEHTDQIRWDYTLVMWNEEGHRKSLDELTAELYNVFNLWNY